MNRIIMSAAVTAAALTQLSQSSMAQEIPAGTTTDSRTAFNNKISRVEVKAPSSEVELRRRAAVAMQVVGRDELDKYGDSNLSDTLRRLPGVDLQNGAPRLRGLGSGYTKVLINGDPAPQGFSIDQLSPAQVERIEITKGATADQTAQAIGGTINIILKVASRKPQKSLRLGASYTIDHPTANANAYYSDRIGDLSYSIPLSGFEWRNENRLQVARVVPPDHSLQTARMPNWGHSINATPQLAWRISNDESLSLQLFLQRGDWKNAVRFEDIEATSGILLEDPSQNRGTFENQRATAQWSRRFNDTQKLELRLTGGHAVGSFINQTFRIDAPYRHSDGESTDKTILQSGKFAQLAGASHALSAGWELEHRRRDDERHVTILGQPQLPGIDGFPFSARIERHAFFLQDEWDLSPRLAVYLGVRRETIKTRSESIDADTNAENVSQVVTPLLHLSFKPRAEGKDLVRVGLTRSYKAPDLNALLARPALNSLYPLPNQTNNEIATDRAGNPDLRPELATGIDIAYEKYFTTGGMLSIGLFHRKVSDLVRYVTSLESVSWASAPRWISRPRNFSRARSSGLELELKGKAAEFLPAVFDPKLDLSLRAAVNVYRSRVDAVPAANNRLDNQQPWSSTLGFDYAAKSVPLTVGATLAYTPGYLTQETISQSLDQSPNRALDVYGQWKFGPKTALRFAVTNAAPMDVRRTTATASGAALGTLRKSLTSYSLSLDVSL